MRKGVIHKGLGDKIYQGIPTLFTPFKRYRKRKMTQEEKDYNRELSGIRSVVEQVNKRRFWYTWRYLPRGSARRERGRISILSCESDCKPRELQTGK